MESPERAKFHPKWEEMLDYTREHVFPCAIPIYAYQNNNVVQCGSGVLLKINFTHFILTAAHIVDFYEILNVPLMGGSTTPGGPPTVLKGARSWTSPLNPKLDKIRDYRYLRDKENDPFDCAYIQLSEETVAELSTSRRFATLQEVDVEHPHTQGVLMLSGFPREWHIPNNEKKVIETKPFRFLTQLEEPPTDEDGVAMHLKYPAEIANLAGEDTATPEPDGISGCGVWRLSHMPKIDQWQPEHVKLVGIDHAWVKVARRVLVTPVAYVLQAIYDSHSDLRKIMDLHLGKVTRAWQV